MESSNRIEQPTDDKSVLLMSLKEQQNQVREGSLYWHELQSQINQIIAERFLQTLNR